MKRLNAAYKVPSVLRIRQGLSEFEATPGNFILKTKAQLPAPPPPTENPSPSSQLLNQSAISRLTNLLMPRNYQKSTLVSYPLYVQNTMISSCFGTAASVLSTQALLVSIGIGSSSSSVTAAAVLPLAATVNWILKDGMGQFGGILFANYINTSFDADPKRFRLGADICLACGVVLESLTSVFPGSFLLLASSANVLKNVAWISASATRASIHHSFCKEHNLADITAKAGSQTMSASLVGTALGISASYLCVTTPMECIAACFMFNSLHVATSFLALQHVQLNTLNIQRAWLALLPGMTLHAQTKREGSVLCALDLDAIATPEQVSKEEQIVHLGKWSGTKGKAAVLASPLALAQKQTKTPSWWTMFFPKRFNTSLFVNPGLDHFLSSEDLQVLIQIASEFSDQHLLNVKPVLGRERCFEIQLWFLQSATNADVMQGFLHASLVSRALAKYSNMDMEPDAKFFTLSRDVRQAMRQVNAGPRYCAALESKGWDLKHVFIEDQRDLRRLVF